MNTSDRVANLVQRTRKSRGWSQGKLAREAGVATGTVGSIELAKKVREGNLRAVLSALELDPAVMDEPQVEGAETDGKDVQVALDIVRTWLEGKEPGDARMSAVHEIVRWTLSQQRPS